MPMTRVLVAAFTSILVLAACTDGGGGDDDGGPTPAARPSSPAMIRIVQPAPGEVIEGGRVQIEVQLSGATLVEEATTQIRPDEGHIHLALDGETIDLLAGLEETLEVEPGTHLLEVEFAAGDHGPFDPRVVQSVTFSVE
jgi:hypothetical protein